MITMTVSNTHSKAITSLALVGTTLTVTYTNGRTYAYKGVLAKTILSLTEATLTNGSLGAWVNKEVKPFYPYEEVTA